MAVYRSSPTHPPGMEEEMGGGARLLVACRRLEIFNAG